MINQPTTEMFEIKISYFKGETLHKTGYPKKQNTYKYANGTPKESLLGSGGFGNVYLVKTDQSPQLFAMKIFNKVSHMTTHGHKESDMIKEIYNAFKDDPFMQRSLPRLEEAFYDENDIFHQVTDYIEGSPLKKCILNNEETFGMKKKKEMIFTLLYIYGKLHEKGYIHRDIKPGNIMIRHDITKSCNLNKSDIWKNIVVIDFGFTCKIDECDDETKGTILYMAPELLEDKKIKYKNRQEKGLIWERSDVWALVVSFYQIMFSTMNGSVYPFYSNAEDKSEKKNQVYEQIVKKPKKFKEIGDHAIDSIIQDVLIAGIDKFERPNISDLIEKYGKLLTLENGNIYILSVEKKIPENIWYGRGSDFAYNINGSQWTNPFSLNSSKFGIYSFKVCVPGEHPVYVTNDLSGESKGKIFGSFRMISTSTSRSVKPIEPISKGVFKLILDQIEEKEKSLCIQCANHPKMGACFEIIRNKNEQQKEPIQVPKIDIIGRIDHILDPQKDTFVVRIDGSCMLWSRKNSGPICQHNHTYEEKELIGWLKNCKKNDNICKKCQSERK